MLSIGDFSKISSVTTKTLRYYDEIGLLKPKATNNENGYRYYDVKQLETILLINKLKRYCFSLEEIAGVLGSPNDDGLLFSLAKQKKEDIQEKIHSYSYILSQLEKDIANLERGVHIMSYLDEIQVKLTETQSKTIISVREKINISEFDKLMVKLYEKLQLKKLTPTGPPIAIYHEEEFNPLSTDIEVAFSVKEIATGTRDLTGGLCATATLKGPYTELSGIYASINKWVEAEGYVLTSAPYEIYMTDPSQTAPEDNITDVYFPVKKNNL